MSKLSITIDDGLANGMEPVHPGEILADELAELGLSASAFAKLIQVPINRVTAILNGDRGITADTALRLARYLGTTAQFWLKLQALYDLKRALAASGESILASVEPRAA